MVGAGLLVGSSVLAVPIFLLTAVIFVLFPRIGLGILTVRSRADTVMAGFGTSVDLSGHGTIRTDQTIVLRVQPPDLPENPPPVRTFRLRGTTFDTYNGRSWSRRPNVGGDHHRIDRDGTLYSLTRAPDPQRDPRHALPRDRRRGDGGAPAVEHPSGERVVPPALLEEAPHLPGDLRLHPEVEVDHVVAPAHAHGLDHGVDLREEPGAHHRRLARRGRRVEGDPALARVPDLDPAVRVALAHGVEAPVTVEGSAEEAGDVARRDAHRA